MISACKATLADGSLTSGIAANAFLKDLTFHYRFRETQKNTKARITCQSEASKHTFLLCTKWFAE